MNSFIGLLSEIEFATFQVLVEVSSLPPPYSLRLP